MQNVVIDFLLLIMQVLCLLHLECGQLLNYFKIESKFETHANGEANFHLILCQLSVLLVHVFLGTTLVSIQMSLLDEHSQTKKIYHICMYK